jgi:hypothetical protein
MRLLLRLLTAALFLAFTQAKASDPSTGKYAVARVYTHGASATCVYTTQGGSYFIGCGHAESGSDRTKKHGIDIQVPAGYTAPQPTSIKVLAWSSPERMDLSLIYVNAGPFPYVAPVAPRGWNWQGKQLVSCGYDEMKQLQIRPCSVLRLESDGMFVTRERPWHGRSGGGLIDQDGFLAGVVSGYRGPRIKQEVIPGSVGVYSSHVNIVTFLDKNGYGWLITGSTQPAPQVTPQQIIPQPRYVIPEPLICPT